MKTLFKQGASQGDGPREAYFVNVRVVETIAREDIRDGSVNVVIEGSAAPGTSRSR